MLSIKRGGQPVEEARGVLQEYYYGKPSSSPGSAALLQGFGNAVMIGHGMSRAFSRAGNAPTSAYVARAVQGALGTAGQIASSLLARSGVQLAVQALGGPDAMGLTGKGSKQQMRVTMNVPTSVKETRRRSQFGDETTIVRPAVKQVHVSNIEYSETPNGAQVNLYRADPLTGETKGAPVRHFSIDLSGRGAANLKQMEKGLATQITKIANTLVGGRPLKIPRPILQVERGPGRPSRRELTKAALRYGSRHRLG